MPSYKNDKNKWYCSFYYTDYQGKRKKKKKEGFSTKREADKYEREYITLHSGEPNITFTQLCNVFLEDYKHTVRETTYTNRVLIINKHFIPYFESFKQIADIKPLNIKDFQNSLIKQGFKASNINKIITMLSQIFKYAIDYYNLSSNPCNNIKTLKKDKQDFNILTEAEFKEFIQYVDEKERIFFITLFYTGLRVGEALALTWADFKENTLIVNKTMVKIDGQEEYNEPKTKKGNREVILPSFLVDMLNTHYLSMYKPKAHHNIFLLDYEAYRYMLNDIIKKHNLKPLRLHDFRHSHISHLIHLNVNPVAIAERVGHESASITLNVYGHLYSEDKNKIANMLSY